MTHREPDERRDDFAHWLRERTGAKELRVSSFHIPPHGGLSNETLLCSVTGAPDHGLDPGRLVIRLEPSDPRIFPSYDLVRESRILRILGTHTDIPVPVVRWLESDDAILGQPFCVMDHVEGSVPADSPPFLLSGWLHDANSEQQWCAQSSFFRALERIHDLDWRELGLGFCSRDEFGPPGLDQEFAYWRHYLDWSSQTGPQPILEDALAWCTTRRPKEESPPCFLWGDARLGNVIFGADFRPAAFLDWEMAQIGPAELDLGWALFLHDTALMWLEDLPGFRERADLLAVYSEAHGRAPEDLAFYEAWAGFRAAAIRSRIVQCDHQLGRSDAARITETDPVIRSLYRLIRR